MRTDQALRFFSTEAYGYKRLEQLQKRGYLKRYARYLQVTAKGLRVLSIDSPVLRLRKEWEWEHRAGVSDVYFMLSSWQFQFALETKRGNRDIYKNARFDAVITKDGRSLALYLIGEVRASTLAALKRDWSALRAWGLSGAVVLCRHEAALSSFDAPDLLKDLNLSRLFVLPYPQGVTVLNSIDLLHLEAAKLFPDFALCPRPFADLEKGDTLVSFLITNDLVKRNLLQGYIAHVREKEARKNIIVCLEFQKARFAELFPDVEIVTVPDLKTLQKGAVARA
ncbi:MAG: hypothetical protein AB1330_11770 [Bacillota bacterium]